MLIANVNELKRGDRTFKRGLADNAASVTAPALDFRAFGPPCRAIALALEGARRAAGVGLIEVALHEVGDGVDLRWSDQAQRRDPGVARHAR
jgi:hypothetical protein